VGSPPDTASMPNVSRRGRLSRAASLETPPRLPNAIVDLTDGSRHGRVLERQGDTSKPKTLGLESSNSEPTNPASVPKTVTTRRTKRWVSVGKRSGARSGETVGVY